MKELQLYSESKIPNRENEFEYLSWLGCRNGKIEIIYFPRGKMINKMYEIGKGNNKISIEIENMPVKKDVKKVYYARYLKEFLQGYELENDKLEFNVRANECFDIQEFEFKKNK